MSSHRPRKRFGQNFLRDQNVLDRIIEAAGLEAGDRILEIGPGPGALTERLLATGLPVTAIEIDRDLGSALEDRDEDNLSVVIGDALRLDWVELLQSPPYKLVANLPYNVSSQILFKVLENRRAFSRMVLMFQKEVGERLVAAEGTRDYGILSVLMQSWFRIEKVVKVPPQAFYPPPKVDSVVLKFELLQEPLVAIDDETLHRSFVKAAFAKRRKTLRNSLVGSGWDTDMIDNACRETGIDPKRRGETLTLEEFAGMANCLKQYEAGD